jgi:hypothetical protein
MAGTGMLEGEQRTFRVKGESRKCGFDAKVCTGKRDEVLLVARSYFQCAPVGRVGWAIAHGTIFTQVYVEIGSKSRQI